MRNLGRFLRLARYATVLGPALVFSGCAVMRIDVDVYKGPLANDEVVQLQQFQSMAPGMQEVLVQLRDRLEWPGLPVWQCAGGSKKMTIKEVDKGGRNKDKEHELCPPDSRYRAGPMSPELLKDPRAARVNAVLSLFEDRTSPDLQALRRSIERAAAQYQAALAVLDPSDGDKKLWSTFKEAMLKPDDFSKKYGTNLESDQLPILNASFEEFQKRFQRLVDPLNARCDRDGNPCRWRTPGSFLSKPPPGEHQGIEESFIGLLSKLVGEETILETTFQDKSANARFERLFARIPRPALTEMQPYQQLSSFFGQSPAIPDEPTAELEAPPRDFRWIDLYAEILFGDESTMAKKDFKRAVSDIGMSFHAARQALRDLWLPANTYIAILDGLSLESGQRDRLRQALAALIANIVQPQNLAVAMKAQGLESCIVGEIDESYPACGAEERKFSKFPERGDIGKRASDLEMLLFREPGKIAPFLRELDKTLIELLDNDSNLKTALSKVPDKDRYSYKFKTGRQYGLVRGPTLDLDSTDQNSQLIQGAIPSLFRIIGGLARGRPNEGVFTNIEEFIQAEQRFRRCNGDDECETRDKTVRIAREELTQGLVHFSQKVLAIANNDVLLPESEVDVDNRDLRDTKRAFVPVLQAIGNTFLIQADELQARARHKDTLRQRGDPERRALELSLGRTPHRVLDDLILDLNVRLSTAQRGRTSAKGKADTIDAKLAEASRMASTAGSNVSLLQGKSAAAQGEWTNAVKMATPAIQTYRTLFAELDWIAGPFQTTETVADLKADKNKLAAQIEDGPANLSIDDLKKLVVAWLEGPEPPGQIVNLGLSNARQSRLKDMRDFLKSGSSDLVGSTQDERDTVLDQFREKVRNYYSAATGAVKAAADKRQKATSDLQKAQQELQRHTDAVADLTIKKAEADKKASEAEATVEQLSDALEVVERLRKPVLDQVAEPGKRSDPPAVFELLKKKLNEEIAMPDQLKDLIDGNRTPADEALKNARTVLDAYPLPGGRTQIAALPVREEGENFKGDQKAVLDDLIASLRYADIEAERSGQAGQAQAIEAALKKAYEYRAEMIYIRPASSYLKSSFAATSLQGDPTLGWRNLLSRHAARSLPFFIGEALANGDATEQEIRAQLDKQFWQNINSVRVAGGGITNYALIKDDIGNWSVKSYSANPEPIIKAAQSLALYNLGGALDTNLLRVNELRSKDSLNDGEQRELNLLTERTTGATPAMRRLFEHHENRFFESTETHYNTFRSTVSGDTLRTRVQTAWRNSLQGSDETLRNNVVAIAESDDALENAQEKVAERRELPPLETEGSEELIEANRQARRQIAEDMGDSIIGAIADLNAYRTHLTTQLLAQLPVRGQLGEVQAAAGKVQETEQEIAVLKAQIALLKEAIKKLEEHEAAAADDQKPAIEADIAGKRGDLEDKEGSLEEKNSLLATAQATLAQAKSELALREIQLKAVLGDANRILGGVILDITRKRSTAISAFEQALLFIGDTPEPANDPLNNLPQTSAIPAQASVN